MTVSSLLFVHNARSLVKTPYQHQGRLPGVAIDCIGVIICTMKLSGCNMMGFEEYAYGPVPTGHFEKNLDKYFDRVWWKADKPAFGFQRFLKSGDILAMTWRERAMHCGIVAVGAHGWNVIHAYSAAKEVVEHRIDEDWADRVVGVYRVRDVR